MWYWDFTLSWRLVCERTLKDKRIKACGWSFTRPLSRETSKGPPLVILGKMEAKLVISRSDVQGKERARHLQAVLNLQPLWNSWFFLLKKRKEYHCRTMSLRMCPSDQQCLSHPKVLATQFPRLQTRTDPLNLKLLGLSLVIHVLISPPNSSDVFCKMEILVLE